MSVNDRVSAILLAVLILAVVLLALLYSVRVVRHNKDPLRWGLLVLMLSIGLTNLPALCFYLGESWPQWLTWVVRVLAVGSLAFVARPLLKDTWHEIHAWCRVAVDSWRLFVSTGKQRKD